MNAGVKLVLVFAALVPLGCDRGPSMTQSARVVAEATSGAERPIGPVPGPASRPAGMPNPFADNHDARREGRRLFVLFNCSGCHGGHAGGGMGPSLRDASWIYGNEAADVFDSIAEGRAHGMPAFGSLLPSESIWQLVTYIESLGTSDEAQPPR